MNWSLVLYFLAFGFFIGAIVSYVLESIERGIIFTLACILFILVGGIGLAPSSSPAPRIPRVNDRIQLGGRQQLVSTRTDFSSSQASVAEFRSLIRKFADEPVENLRTQAPPPVPPPPAPASSQPAPAPANQSGPSVPPPSRPAPLLNKPDQNQGTGPKRRSKRESKPRSSGTKVTSSDGFNNALAAKLGVSEAELKKALGKDGVLMKEGFYEIELAKGKNTREELENDKDIQNWLKETQEDQRKLVTQAKEEAKAQEAFEKATDKYQAEVDAAAAAERQNQQENERFRLETQEREAELLKLDGQLAATPKKIEVQAVREGNEYVYTDPNTGKETRVKIKFKKVENKAETEKAQKAAKTQLKADKDAYEAEKQAAESDLADYNALRKKNRDSKDGLDAKDLKKASELQARLTALFNKKGNVKVPYLADSYKRITPENQLYQALFIYPSKKDDKFLKVVKKQVMKELNKKGSSYNDYMDKLKRDYAKGMRQDPGTEGDWSKIFGDKPYNVSQGKTEIKRNAGWNSDLKNNMDPDLVTEFQKLVGGTTFDAFKTYKFVADVAQVTEPFNELLKEQKDEAARDKLKQDNSELDRLNTEIEKIKGGNADQVYQKMEIFVRDRGNKINLAKFNAKPDLPSFGDKITEAQLGKPPDENIDLDKLKVFDKEPEPPKPREYDNPDYQDIKKKKKKLPPVAAANIVPVPAVSAVPALAPVTAVSINVSAVPAVAPAVVAAPVVAPAAAPAAAPATAVAAKPVPSIDIANIATEVKVAGANPTKQQKAKVGARKFKRELINQYATVEGKSVPDFKEFLETPEGANFKKKIAEEVLKYKKRVNPTGKYKLSEEDEE